MAENLYDAFAAYAFCSTSMECSTAPQAGTSIHSRERGRNSVLSSDMPQKPKLSAWEYITLFGAIAHTFATCFGAFLTAPLAGSRAAPTAKRHALYAAIRKFQSSTTTRQTQALATSTLEVYEVFIKAKGVEAQVIDNGETKGCWIGEKTAGVVILWLHGGGYAAAASRAHMQLIWNLVARTGGKKVAAFIPQYSLAPGAVYPQQLIEATNALLYLTSDMGLLLSQIIVGGDSAGGNLTLALLSHVMHPHPDVPTIATVHQVFRGVFLISPWVTFDQTAPAFFLNAKKDVLDASVLRRWSNAFVGSAPRNNYTVPLDADPAWWLGLPTNHILVTAGADELFVDDVKDFVQKLSETKLEKLDVLIADRECHDSPVLDLLFRDENRAQTVKLHDWMRNRL